MGHCNDINKPSVNEDALKCDELRSTDCVVLEEAVPCLRAGKGTTLTSLFAKFCDFFKNLTFLGLKDTPSSYTGLANNLVKVNSTENGLTTTNVTELPFLEYTVLTVPSAASNQGVMIMVIDEVDGYVPAFSDGSNWRRVTDRNIIS